MAIRLPKLINAADKGEESIVRSLLDEGIDVHCKTRYGSTALHHASSSNGRETIISLLIERGADVNLKNKDGDTPLHFASYHGREANASLLIEKGADVKIKNKAGKSPLDDARERNKICCVRILEQVNVVIGMEEMKREISDLL